MMMRSLSTALVLVATLSGTPAAAAQVPDDLTEMLPTSTVLLFQVEEFGKFALLDEDGAIATLARHEAVKAAFEQMYSFFGTFDDDEFLLALDLEKEELGRLFGGRMLFALPELSLLKSDVKVGAATTVALSLEPTRGVVALVDYSGTVERLEELLESYVAMREDEEDVHKAALLTDEFNGVTVYNVAEVDAEQKVDEALWLALVDDLIIASDEEETLYDFIDLADQGAPEGDRLADDPRFREALDLAGEHDALLYANLGELMPMVNDLLEYQLEKAGMSVAMFLRPSDLIAALRLDALQSAFATLHVDDEEAGLVFGFTHTDTDYGLQTLLTYDDSGVEIPSYFSSDFHSASISNFDLAAAYENFDRMLLKASPTGHGMLRGQIEMLEKDTFPLREALLDNMAGRFVEVLGYPEASLAGPEDHPSQAYVLKLNDGQSLAEGLAKLAEDQGESDPVEFMNETIHVLPLAGILGMGRPDAVLAVAIVGNDLVATMGDRKMCENIIAHLKNPGADLLLDDEDLLDAFDALPDEHVVALGFIDVANTLQNVIRGTDDAVSFKIASAEEAQDIESLIAAQQAIQELPDVSDIDYYIVTKTYKSADSFIQRMLLRPNLGP